jgi:rubrerythrin
VHLTDAQGVRKDFESLDEGDKPGIREDNSDMPKGARMEKSNADRTFAERRMAAEQQEVVSTRPIRKAIVHYSGSADAAVEAMMKGRTRGILDIASHGVAGSPLQKSTTCSSCGRAHAAFMTVCPTCGTGQMEERSSGNVIVKSAPSLPGLPAGFVTPFRRVTITGGE